ncbi:PREDICTED: uncharacterized protein LOC108358266 isoform X2 [Rhagoletis zephyria]|uniref:uncharacterized protein LOC108358266 isoform X2 n=1 Tax=Rhagoletis zephyria TaxID=28612 RepID=UPI0008115BFD|nr:PREDICTED: uncharacterized protein LOC108358266 isoform X2 [Rhagoletis zephyria]
MPNYRQKNKKNKNKNRQKQQQQQQQQNQQDNKNKSQNQNQQANQPSATQNRQSTGNKDNQSQGRAQREQSNQQQPPKSPKSPTPTTTATATTLPTPLAPADEPVNSSQQHHASSQDAREVDSTATTPNASTATIFVQSDNLSSNEPSDFAAPTSSHQAITATVDREECNRVEDADADALLSKLDNKEAATYSEETAHSFRSEKGVEEFTMGNKDSKTSITSNDATALATTDDRAVATATADLCGVIRPDRTIVGARELETLQPATKTQMAKVIVHRIVRESSEDGEGEKEKERQKDEDIDKVAQVARAGKQKLAQATEERQKTAVNDGQIADDVDGAQKSQRSKVIIHNIEQQAGGGGVGVSLQPAKAESKVIVHPIQQEGGNEAVVKKLHTSEGGKVIVHKIAQELQDVAANKGASLQRPFETKAVADNGKGMSDQLIDDAKVIIHHIQLDSTSPINYRVESPDALSPTAQLGRSKQSILNKSIVQIQEISDESSSEYNDNPPVISEGESETESTAGACALDYAQTVRTLSPDSEDNYEFVHRSTAAPSQEPQQDLKQRRAQKRVALETHFLPQLLSPRYLDSILEENSDMSDARSDCSENHLMTTLSGDDLRDQAAAKVRKANEIFPRSNLDFSRRHAKKQLGALPKKPLPIREEPVAMVVAAKLIEATTPAQECCVRLSSEHTPESEAAEVIYLSSSASSSLSDLVELDAEAGGGEGDDERDDSCRSTVDLDTDVREIITKPGSEERAAAAPNQSDSRESTPVNQASTRLSEKIKETQKLLANNNTSVEQTTKTAIDTNIDAGTVNATITNPIESKIYENLKSLQLLAEPSGERALSSGSGATTTTTSYRTAAATTSESETETEMSSDTTTERCEYLRSSDTGGSGSGGSSSSLNSSSIEMKYPPATIATSDSLNVDPAVLLENIELEMNSVREILNSHTIETTAATSRGNGNFDNARSSELNTDHFNSAKKASPSPPPIPPPPTSASASDYHSDFTGLQTQPPAAVISAPPPIPTRAPHDSTYVETYTPEQKSPQPTSSLYTTNSALTSLSLLRRQESAESHCSDSTQHSQCTAINVGSRPHTDHELTPPLTATSPISDYKQEQQQLHQYNNWTDARDECTTPTATLNATSVQNDASIKKPRLLCTETLASMPYGEQVLEELATVAQNIGELQAKTPTHHAEEKNFAATEKTDGTTMPYPLPQLPHISELQMSIADDQPPHASDPHSKLSSTTSATTTHKVAIKQLGDPERMPRDLTTANMLHSPSPPPVPAPPSHYSDAPWLGVPTAADPNVLVCLSPAQRQQLATDSSQQPDQLLDAHQKFLERRGYHEYTEEQVKTLNAALQQEEQQILKTAAYMKKLRKSLTPPPPPVPPPPVPSKSSETAAKAQNQVRTASTSSSSGGSSAMISSQQQRVYDATNYRNANEQTTSTFANGEEPQQQNQAYQSQQNHLQTLIEKTGKPADADAVAVSVAGSSSQQQQKTSSLENNSRQSSDAAYATGAQGGEPAFEGKQPATSADTRQYSNANASEPTSNRATSDLYGGNNYVNISFPPSAAGKMHGVESELAKMFPSMGASNIFDSNRKRFSNIESSTASSGGPYCAQLQSTLPKRYSNIETHSYEAKKRMENGEVVYDYTDSHHERQTDGDKSLDSTSTPSLLHFPVREPSKELLQYPVDGDGMSSRSVNSEIMSAIKLNTTENAKTIEQDAKAERKEQANSMRMTNFTNPGATTSATTTSSSTTSHFANRSFGTAAETTIREEDIKNSKENGRTVQPLTSGGAGNGSVSGSSTAYEEFRQRAKAAADAFGALGETPATAPPLGTSNAKHSAFNFQHDRLFKDFDALSQQLNMELEEGKAQRQQREKSASLYDLSRTQWNFKDHFDQLKKQRHEHMQELEREIERSARSRHSKGQVSNGAPAGGRTFEIPIRIEDRNGKNPHGASDRSSAPRELTQPRSYNIPIVMENGAAPKVPPPPSPSAQYDTVDDASRFRRAESMFNLSENTARPQPQAHQQQPFTSYERPQSSAADDWSRYASDFGSSENITRPFAREVEICYQRQRPRTIRAPRLSASTNDLSSNSQCYDSYNAYNVRRSHAPMLQPVAHQQRPQHHASCYSVLERDPNPTYISTTTRRGVSPAPVSPAAQPGAQEPLYSPHAPERQRRASLPREIQEQQLKYISSKEEELRMEFERLQNERRRLLDELNTPPVTLQMPQHPMRDIYRPMPKLPTLTEDEVFRQQMAEEWLSKVAEREERRLQKIIKISKVNETQQGHQPPVPPNQKTDISDEFLKRVQERRTKLAMPADSDWESGAESQPVAAGHASESDAEVPPVKVLEGKSETDLRQLPRHLREFARFSNHNEEKIDGGHRVVHQEEERRQEANANSMSSAVKKSSMVKTVKIARQPEIVGQASQRLPTSVQQRQQQQQRQQEGHSRTTSGSEQARPQLKSTGYQSEPEPNYDSDYSTVKYRTLDRRRLQSVSSATNVANRSTNSYQDDKLYGTMPNPIKSEPSTYKNQPGRIEDYVTGRSSVSEKERKEWWDEVMDIFNGHLDQAKLSPHYTEGNLSRALAKESGYTSDSNLVFRKREAPQASPLSPVEQKQAYKSVQAGGEPPLFGFRKPAPERPRDDGNEPPVPPKPRDYRAESPNRYLESDVNIHFKTPIRHEYKQAMSDEELAQRQAEQMQKLYQEERRRKYLQELQDMNARRHTDNFTPTQKSPIPLNRYDDFQSDLAPKSPNTITTRTAARALYNFQGQNARELSFKKGDIIYIRRQIDRNWYEGEHNAMIGLLPVSYVEIVNKESTRLQPKKPSEGQARAKYNFQAQSGIELSLNKGELVTLTRRVDENWFEGKIANRKGIFPVSYVEVLTDIGAEDIAARTVISEHASVTNLRPSLDTLRTNINNEFNFITKNGHQPPNGILKETKQHHSNKIDALHVDTHSEPLVYRALYKYRPQNSDEMELLEGDIVHVLEICDDGWFVGTSQRTGCFGTFPGNYVERVL